MVYTCDKCGQQFKWNNHYHNHLNRVNPCKKKEVALDCDFSIIKEYYDNILNKDKSTYKSKNDEPTPISCIEEMIEKIPIEFWERSHVKILDPCSGNGNFFIPIYYKLKERYTQQEILQMLYFNDTNDLRLNNIKKIFNGTKHKLNITSEYFLNYNEDVLYDLIVANPPYAKLLENGKRASKNHNMIKEFIHKKSGSRFK